MTCTKQQKKTSNTQQQLNYWIIETKTRTGSVWPSRCVHSFLLVFFYSFLNRCCWWVKEPWPHPSSSIALFFLINGNITSSFWKDALFLSLGFFSLLQKGPPVHLFALTVVAFVVLGDREKNESRRRKEIRTRKQQSRERCGARRKGSNDRPTDEKSAFNAVPSSSSSSLLPLPYFSYLISTHWGDDTTM